MINIPHTKPLCNDTFTSSIIFLTRTQHANIFKQIILLLMISLFFCSFSQAKDPESSNQSIEKSIRGIAITGFNRVLGSPATDLRFLGNMSFPIISAVSEDGEIKPIDNDSEPDDLLVSQAIDEVYSNIFGISETESIPLQGNDFADIPQLSDLAGNESVLPQLNENSNWWSRSNGAQLREYKVKQWLKAKGQLNIQCSNNQQAIYKLKLKNLVPGGLYTVQAFFFDQQEGELITDIPFGGTSANVFSSDFRGNAVIKQNLNFCPQEIDESERYQLIEVCVVLHTDGKVYSGVPHTVAKKPYIGPGINALPHIMFPIK